MKGNVRDNVIFSEIKDKADRLMKIADKSNNQEQSTIKYIEDCLDVVKTIIGSDKISKRIYNDLHGFRLVPEETVCLIRRFSEGTDLRVDIYEIPMDCSYAKRLTTKDIVNLYGSHEFGCMIFAAMDKMEKHYEKITNSDEHIHKKDLGEKAKATNAAALAAP